MSLAINHIEIENFKSYYGKNILGPFHQSFNSVIGPNGSGKSNVIDSLLFVFGFRAQKIRTKKISVLIHNSEKHQNVKSCSVTIYFHKIKETGPHKFEVIPNSEFTIKRTAYKDNNSDYFIDNKRSQYKDVQQLLIGHGVDLDHNRFLILQGEVESISLLKPKAANEHEEGLLEYLEDIIGTISYKPRLEEISVEIDKTNEIHMEKANRVNNLQKDRQALDGPKNDALKYLRLENEQIKKKNCLYQIKTREIGNVVVKSKKSCDEIQNELNEVSDKLLEFSKANEEASANCNVLKKEFDKKSKLDEKYKKKIEDLEKEDIHIREGIKHANEQIKKLRKNIETESEKLKNYEEAPTKNPEKIVELEAKIKESEMEREELSKELEKLMDKVNEETIGWQKEKKEKEEKLNDLQKSVNEAKSKMNIEQSKIENLLHDQNYEQNKLDDIQKKLKDLEKLSIDRNDGVGQLEQQMPTIEKELNDLTIEFNQILNKEKELSERIKLNRDRFSEAKSNFAASGNRNSVLKFLMQLKSEGKITGIYGRLGDLGAIDEKYDIAISTACGALDKIVVDSIDTAQKCVEYLKKNNVGVASFLALDKTEKWRDNLKRKFNSPENVPRLVDLVKVGNENLMTAFYAELRNTLVADNLEQASRIAYGQQRNRVVTLKGELIEVTGTMSGGGRPQKGRMGTKVVEDLSSDVIKQMENTLRNDEGEMREIIGRKQLIEPKIDELKAKLEKNKIDLLKWKQEIISLKEQIIALKKGEIECRKKLKEVVLDEKKKNELEGNLDGFRQEYEKAEQKASKVRQDCDQLHEKIMNTNKKILEKPKTKLENLDNELKEMKNQVTSLNVEIKSSTRLISNSKKKMNSLNEDFEQNEEKAQKFQKRLQEMDIEGQKLIEEHEKVKEELKELQDEISEKTKVNKETEKEKQKFEKSKIDLTHKLDKLMQDLNNDDRELKHFKHRLESLKLHEVNMERLRIQFMNKQDNLIESVEKLLKYSDEELDEVDIGSLNEELEENEEKLKTMNPNTAAIQNYLELEEKFQARMNELEEVEKKRSELEAKYDELKKKRLEEFMAGFIAIKTKLKEIYRTITFEGDAELELVDTLNPFTEGVVLSIRPPKKSWKNISNLSGGEKTLSSLSLVFALHEYRATPIYVMDEIDAALDFKNVSIIAKYIKDRTKNAQFIIISLRNNMFELADRLFGIYKVNNCTSASYIAPELSELEEKSKKRKEEEDELNATIIATQNENLISS